mgnify:CR=1 FL=1
MATVYEKKIWGIVSEIFAEADFAEYRLTRTLELPKELASDSGQLEETCPTCLISYEDSDGERHQLPYQKPFICSWQKAKVDIRWILKKQHGASKPD